MPSIRDIISTLEAVAPARLQESYDNTGYQVLVDDGDAECTGVLVCVDLTDTIVDEAVERGCNLIVTHHPLLFHAVKRIDGVGRVQRALVDAIRHGISVYSCHTALDNAPVLGVSHAMARRLGLVDVSVLEIHTDPELGTVGSGVVGLLPEPMSPREFVELVKTTFHSPIARCSDPDVAPATIRRVALCGGAGSFLVDEAMARGADAFLASDCKFNTFLDVANDIFLVDIGHYESEECAKDIFCHVITEKFPNFAVCKSEKEKNPINYL